MDKDNTEFIKAMEKHFLDMIPGIKNLKIVETEKELKITGENGIQEGPWTHTIDLTICTEPEERHLLKRSSKEWDELCNIRFGAQALN